MLMNMNVNEVIVNCVFEIMGNNKGEYGKLSFNSYVNMF